VDQHGNTDLETVWQIGNILLFAGESQSSTTEAEVFSDDESAAAEFARRFENMKAMEAEAKAEWAESHAQ
jgi:hypothetical protein